MFSRVEDSLIVFGVSLVFTGFIGDILVTVDAILSSRVGSFNNVLWKKIPMQFFIKTTNKYIRKVIIYNFMVIKILSKQYFIRHETCMRYYIQIMKTYIPSCKLGPIKNFWSSFISNQFLEYFSWSTRKILIYKIKPIKMNSQFFSFTLKSILIFLLSAESLLNLFHSNVLFLYLMKHQKMDVF